MKTLIRTFILILLFNNHLFAQNFIVYGDKTFGGALNEENGNIVKTGDFSFLVGGNSSSNLSGDKTVALCDSNYSQEIDNWVISTDTSFSFFWQVKLGGDLQEKSPIFYQFNNSVNFYFSCSSKSNISCEKSENNFSASDDYWIGEINPMGALLWDKTIGGSLTDDYPIMLKLPSKEYFICGVSGSPVGGLKTVPNFGGRDYWCIKLDSSGVVQWDKVYGGIADERGQDNMSLDLVSTLDGKIILVGNSFSTFSGNITDTSNGAQDIWVVKLDSSGNIIWDNLLGGSLLDFSNDACVTSDNGLIICGTTNSPQSGDVSEQPKGHTDIWVIKLDSLGNKQWDKRYGGSNISRGIKIQLSSDGGYWVAGDTNSDSIYDVSEPGYGNSDYWILKIDSVGNKLWDKRFGGPGREWLEDFIILADSSIMLFGKGTTGISSMKTDSGKGGEDFWLVHFKYINNTTGVEDSEITNSITLSPNPSTGVVAIPIIFLNSELNVFDLTGRKVHYQKRVEESELHLEYLLKGCYLFQFKTNGRIYNTRWIKM